MILDPNVGRIILQLVLWLPLVGAIVVALAGSGGRDAPRPIAAARWRTGHSADAGRAQSRAWRIATFFAAVTFLLAAWLLIGFDRARPTSTSSKRASPGCRSAATTASPSTA